MFRCYGVYTFHRRQNTFLLAVAADSQVLFLHVPAGWLQDETGYLEIREACLFHFKQQLVGNFLQRVILLQLMLQVNNMLQALQEPHINLGQFLNALHAVSLFQSLGNCEYTQVGRVLQFVIQVLELRVVVAHETMHTLSDHSQTFLYHFFKRAANRHDFAYRLHA